MSKIYHPDGQARRDDCDPLATNKFQVLKNAFDVLKDAHKRRIYDQYGTIEASGDPFAYIVSDDVMQKCRQKFAGENMRIIH